jgi:hypothetical protein
MLFRRAVLVICHCACSDEYDAGCKLPSRSQCDVIEKSLRAQLSSTTRHVDEFTTVNGANILVSQIGPRPRILPTNTSHHQNNEFVNRNLYRRQVTSKRSIAKSTEHTKHHASLSRSYLRKIRIFEDRHYGLAQNFVCGSAAPCLSGIPRSKEGQRRRERGVRRREENVGESRHQRVQSARNEILRQFDSTAEGKL